VSGATGVDDDHVAAYALGERSDPRIVGLSGGSGDEHRLSIRGARRCPHRGDEDLDQRAVRSRAALRHREPGAVDVADHSVSDLNRAFDGSKRADGGLTGRRVAGAARSSDQKERQRKTGQACLESSCRLPRCGE
jgi:hypothetical protein